MLRICLVLMAFAGLTLLATPLAGIQLTPTSPPDVPAQDAPARRTVEIVAERFLFLTVDAGTAIEFRLTSDDTDHGFRIVGTDINVRIPKRGRGDATVVFTPDAPGDYTFECSHMCGAGHSFMRGQIRVRARGGARQGLQR
jgi:cytochrome c oxidase subunit 2